MEFRRVSLNLDKNQTQMMSFVWINAKEVHLLVIFPGVMMVDTTEKSEKIPLWTTSRKDPNKISENNDICYFLLSHFILFHFICEIISCVQK